MAVGRGHDVASWRDFLSALEKIDPDMAVNIEHEDQEQGGDQRDHAEHDFSRDFVAVGRGHDVAFWRDFLSALEKNDLYMAVNIEHEDQELDQLEGLRFAAQTLREASGRPSRQEFADLTAAPHRFDDPIVIQGQRATHLKYTVRR